MVVLSFHIYYFHQLFLVLQVQLVMATSESNFNEDIKKDFYIPTYILSEDASRSDDVKLRDVPTCPVLVFINSKSGGQLGGDLLNTYQSLLNKDQVLTLVASIHIAKLGEHKV